MYIFRSEKFLQMLDKCMTDDYEERTNESELFERQLCAAVSSMGTAAGFPHGAALGSNFSICKMGRIQYLPQRIED